MDETNQTETVMQLTTSNDNVNYPIFATKVELDNLTLKLEDFHSRFEALEQLAKQLEVITSNPGFFPPAIEVTPVEDIENE